MLWLPAIQDSYLNSVLRKLLWEFWVTLYLLAKGVLTRVAGMMRFVHTCASRRRGIPLEVQVKRLTDDSAVTLGNEATIFMRRRWVSLAILGLLASTPTIGSTEDDRSPAAITALVAVPSGPLQAPWVRDEAVMIMVGSALIGLAAAIRRAA